MSLLDKIPMPGTGMEGFLDALKQGKQRQLADAQSRQANANANLSPYEMQLKQAQTAQAQGNAQKSQMLARLMGEAFGVGGGSGQTEQGGDRAARAKSILQSLNYLKETPKEIEDREMRVAKAKSDIQEGAHARQEQNTANLKRSRDLLDTGDLINKYSRHTIALHNLLNKPGFSTGNLSALKNWANMAGADTGAFVENSVPLVGPLAHELSNKGGAVVTGMVSAAKPNNKKSNDYNKGVIHEMHKQAYQSFQEAKKEYEEITGKPYPKKLDKFFNKVKVISPKGHIVYKSPEEAEKLVKKYPGSTIGGNPYAEQ